MPIERTLSIIKPDAVEKNAVGRILAMLEEAGLTVVATRMTRLTTERARSFYAVHRERPFYDGLVEFMTSGPVVVSVLEAPDAIQTHRKVMGATDPAKAEEGTIRRRFATDIERNAVHGSDGPDTARQEIAFFFEDEDIHPR